MKTYPDYQSLDNRDFSLFPLRERNTYGSELNLLKEVFGQRRPEKQAKVTSAVELWLPAVNGRGEYGRWEFVEVQDPWQTITLTTKVYGAGDE